MAAEDIPYIYLEVCAKNIVMYHDVEWTVGHIVTYFEKGFHKVKRNALYLIPCNGSNSVTYARMRDCELKGKLQAAD